jgi:hypothetical protein
MTDHQLSTHDLAARSDSDEPDSSLETQRSADRGIGASETGDQDAGFEGTPLNAPLTRDHLSDTRADDTRTDPAAGDGGGHLGSGPDDTRAQDSPSAGTDHEALFPSDQSARFTSRWQELQTSFVDQPREAVAEADALVADLMQRLAASFSQERERLEAQWDRGDDVSTEDLRIALTRYRSFFDRLLSA